MTQAEPTIAGNPLTPAAIGNTLPFHGERERLFNELHTRPFPLLEEGSGVSQIALLHEGCDIAAEYRHIALLGDTTDNSGQDTGSACLNLGFDGFELRWERHTEFSTYTFIQRASEGSPFSTAALPRLPAGWLAGLPGKVISGLHIEIHPAAAVTGSTANDVRSHFDGHRLISSWVINRKARLWTAYRIHDEGFGRILVLNKALNPCQLGRLVRRLLEIETYRMMVLLAFPVARGFAPEITAMGHQLAGINAQLNAIGSLDDERRLLGSLSALAARIEHLRSMTNFRFSAARAYYDLVLSRLQGLREEEEPGMQTFNEFLLRRLTPAYRTSESIARQLDDLATRIDRASELLRTRIDLTLEAQNQDLLKSMNQRSQTQLQLQQAVEGLSVVAISYYLIGMVKYVAEALHENGWIERPGLLIGLSVPVCLVLVWRGVYRLRHGLGG
jgi:uncharacterized membrane-anchored protein